MLVSSVDKNGTDDLVQIGFDGQREILLECRDVRCRAGRQQPGGQLVAYERQSIDESANTSEVWLLDTLTGSEQPAYSRELAAETGFDSLLSRFPRWSHDGQYLAYYKPDARVIIIEPISGGGPILIPANLQMLGEWSPERNQIAFIEQVFDDHDLPGLQDEEGENEAHRQAILFNHLIVADVDTREVVDLSAGEGYNDGLPVWHPDGESLAVPRENSGSGRQIWVVEPERREWFKLTDDPFFHHSGLSWSPDGNKLALMRVPVEEANPQAEVQVLDPVSGEMTLISERGFLPGWLP
jgi:Tol biopolymer transport system component